MHKYQMSSHDTIKDLPNPAFFTEEEYIRLLNPSNKFHGSNSYDMTLEKMNSFFHIGDYKLVKRIRVAGLDMELLMNRRKCAYAMKDQDGEHVRRDGELIMYSDEEIELLGYPLYDFSFAITHDGRRVALADNEWGAWLFVVAREYRGLGLGTIIGKIARTYHPMRSSGGFTEGGLKNIKKIHSSFVRDALSSGLYSRAVRDGSMTMERVREITKSAARKPERELPDLSSRDPADWLLYHDGHGTFILYDRKLRDVSDDYEIFREKMIKGMVTVMVNEPIGRIKAFGADTDKLRSFMLSLAYTFCKENEADLYVDPEEYDVKGFEFGEENKKVGYSSKITTKGPTVPYSAMVRAEVAWRKTFDRYDEFLYMVHESAEKKF